MKNPKSKDEVRYSVTISENLSERLDQRVLILKSLGKRKISKQKWIEEAIKEKIEDEEKKKNSIPKAKHLCIALDKSLFLELSERVSKISKFRNSFSKKKYILEAISEKLEREEHEAELLLATLEEKTKKKK